MVNDVPQQGIRTLALCDVLVESEIERLAAEVDHACGDAERQDVTILVVMLDFKTDDFP